jgi:dolichol-phosphate mannosyltransferase
VERLARLPNQGCSLKTNRFLILLAFVQALFALRVMWRMVRTAGGERIEPVEGNMAATLMVAHPVFEREQERVSVIVPVLNEYDRLSPCLEGLIGQGDEVAEIVVVDGGSDDGTQELVCAYSQRDSRVRLVDASPIPATWNGKAWGLQVGLDSLSPNSRWILTTDADVRPRPLLSRSLLAQAKRAELAALSVATQQEIAGIGEGLLHPSLLTTLVYRFGMPGKIMRRVSDVQANGQCFLFRRDVLEACGGFEDTRNSVCEDITVARALVASGYPVGFYEAGDLVSVKMYENWRDTWNNWTCSLPMRDQFSGMYTLSGWLEVLLVQALPLPLLLFLVATRVRSRWPEALNSILLAIRFGVLFGTAHAYRRRPWTYWLSPLCDLPVAVQLIRSAVQRRHIWRGRVFIRGGI